MNAELLEELNDTVLQANEIISKNFDWEKREKIFDLEEPSLNSYFNTWFKKPEINDGESLFSNALNVLKEKGDEKLQKRFVYNFAEPKLNPMMIEVITALWDYTHSKKPLEKHEKLEPNKADLDGGLLRSQVEGAVFNDVFLKSKYSQEISNLKKLIERNYAKTSSVNLCNWLISNEGVKEHIPNIQKALPNLFKKNFGQNKFCLNVHYELIEHMRKCSPYRLMREVEDSLATKHDKKVDNKVPLSREEIAKELENDILELNKQIGKYITSDEGYFRYYDDMTPEKTWEQYSTNDEIMNGSSAISSAFRIISKTNNNCVSEIFIQELAQPENNENMFNTFMCLYDYEKTLDFKVAIERLKSFDDHLYTKIIGAIEEDYFDKNIGKSRLAQEVKEFKKIIENKPIGHHHLEIRDYLISDDKYVQENIPLVSKALKIYNNYFAEEATILSTFHKVNNMPEIWSVFFYAQEKSSLHTLNFLKK